MHGVLLIMDSLQHLENSAQEVFIVKSKILKYCSVLSISLLKENNLIYLNFLDIFYF